MNNERMDVDHRMPIRSVKLYIITVFISFKVRQVMSHFFFARLVFAVQLVTSIPSSFSSKLNQNGKLSKGNWLSANDPLSFSNPGDTTIPK